MGIIGEFWGILMGTLSYILRVLWARLRVYFRDAFVESFKVLIIYKNKKQLFVVLYSA